LGTQWANAQQGTQRSDCAFGFTSYKDLQMRYEKVWFNCQMRNEPNLIVIYHSSLVKSAMNAARVCKLRNGVKKTPQFLLFSMAKGGPSAQ
jgi:hypothetical protein